MCALKWKCIGIASCECFSLVFSELMSSKNRRTERNKNPPPLAAFFFLSFFACFSSTTTITDSFYLFCLQIRRHSLVIARVEKMPIVCFFQRLHRLIQEKEMTSYRTSQISFFFFSARLSSSAEVYLNASFYYL